jgi:hypothetical protein
MFEAYVLIWYTFFRVSVPLLSYPLLFSDYWVRVLLGLW